MKKKTAEAVMDVTFNASDMADAIASIQKIVSPEHISISASGDTIMVSGTAKGKTMRMSISAEVRQEGGFSQFPAIVGSVVASRKEMKFTQEDNTISFSSGKYAGDFLVLPYSEITLEPPEGSAYEFVGAELSLLKKVANTIQISPVFDPKQVLPIALRLFEKGIEAFCGDDYHIVYARNAEASFDTEYTLVLPPGALNTVAMVAGDKDDYQLVLSSSSMYAKGGNFELLTPQLQIDSEEDDGGISRVRGVIKQIREEAATSITIKTDALNAILTNVFGIAEQDIPFVFDIKAKKVKVGSKTNVGSAYDELTAEIEGEAGKYMFHPYLLSEILSKVQSDECTIKLAEAAMVFEEKRGKMSVYGLCLASSDDSED